jgi:hypothetical protein
MIHMFFREKMVSWFYIVQLYFAHGKHYLTFYEVKLNRIKAT